MIIKLHNQIFLQTEKQKKYFLFVFLCLILPFSIFGQTVINNVSFYKIPVDLQLVARNPLDNDNGIISFDGEVDFTLTPYDDIQIKVFRNGVSYGNSPYTQSLTYNGNIATFTFDIKIKAVKKNYSFEVYGLTDGSSDELITTIVNVVAGDVYIIEGQSNAEASKKDSNDSANGNTSNFIRVYANGTEIDSDLLTNDFWYEGDGDVGRKKDGNTGQWGLKLAKLLLDSENVPIAIFNGARGGKRISYFLKNAVNDPDEPTNNYERLLYRLNITNLKEAVKAVFWAQGENTGGLNSVDEYKNDFLNLRSSWLIDYPNVEQVYIFQTRNVDCSSYPELYYIKEAQRQLAVDNNDINIMTTEALTQYTDDCHFGFTNGYEEFANRIFPLVQRDFYGVSGVNINAPNITDVYLADSNTLIVETDANNLQINTFAEIGDYDLINNRGANINSINVLGNKIIFNLSKYPGPNAKISYLGATPGVHDNLITNINGLDLVSFFEYPVRDKPAASTWNGSSWSSGAPDSTMDAIIDADYNANDGNIIANNLTVNTGVNLSFDNGTTNSVVLYGDLTIDGTFTIGDQEALVMYDDSSIITGDITKKERSTAVNNIHDFTYWSASVEDETIASVFSGVDQNRIFYFDQSKTTASDPNNDPDGTYWDVWVPALQSDLMIRGKGYASESDSQSGKHRVSFKGKPNNGIILVDVFENNDSDLENDYNLIGNPYPSVLDMELFLGNISNSAVIDPTVYLWTHNTAVDVNGDFTSSDYATFNLTGGTGTAAADSGGSVPTKNFGSGQGFFVRATNSGQVVFNNSMRIEEANNQFFKTSNTKNKTQFDDKKDRIWLNLMTDQGGYNQILIGFQKKLTNGVDNGYDALKFDGSSNPISFYSVIEDNKYTIQGQRTFISLRKVKLGFDTKIAPRTFTISIAKTEGVLDEANVYLVDKELHITHDLRISDYKFVQNITGEFRDRFLLKFENNSSADIDVEDKNSFTVHNAYNGYTAVKANNKILSIKVYDIYGNLLIEAKPNRYKFVLNTNQIKLGTILLIEASFENGEVVRKKTIKY